MPGIEISTPINLQSVAEQATTPEELEQRNIGVFKEAEGLILPFEKQGVAITPWVVIQPPLSDTGEYRAGRLWLNPNDSTAHAETFALMEHINPSRHIEGTGKLAQDTRNLVTPDQTHTYTFSEGQLLAMASKKGFIPFVRNRAQERKVAAKVTQLTKFEQDALKIGASLLSAGYLRLESSQKTA